eukprot:Skav220802  [mRNA]  locus=scaffold150:387859:398258:+ [translate_table: standard]
MRAFGDWNVLEAARQPMSAFFSRRFASVRTGQGAAALRAVLALMPQAVPTTFNYFNNLPQVSAQKLKRQACSPSVTEELGASEAGRPSLSQRRPADVYLPSWGAHGPAAFDLAATSGLRGSVVAASAADGAVAVTNYEQRKRAHRNTEQLCAGQGLQFIPLVVEACAGGLGPTSVTAFRKLGTLHAARLGLPASEGTAQIFQALSVALQRENARAVLRRLPEASAPVSTDLPGSDAMQFREAYRPLHAVPGKVQVKRPEYVNLISVTSKMKKEAARRSATPREDGAVA